MKNFLSLLAASAVAVLLSACAANSAAPAASANATSASGTMVCHKDKLNIVGTEFECNWASSVKEACDGIVKSSRIAQAAATSAPTPASRCASGLWLVALTMK
jgi:carbohydrate-selective porin OprB